MQVKLKDLKKFIVAIEKKHGKAKASNFKVEVHRPYTIEGEKETFWAPHEMESLSIATYVGERKPTVIFR